MKINELLQSIMEKRGLTPSELTALLGYQSKTSLTRVLHGQSNQRAMDTLIRKLLESIELTDEELLQLDDAMEHLLWQDDYHAAQEMIHFLKGQRDEVRQVSIERTDSGKTVDFAFLYDNARELRFTILNCQFISIFPAMQHYVHDCNAEAEHFLLLGDMPNGVMRAINALYPLLYETQYRCYARRIDRSSEWLHAFGMLASDALVAQYVDDDGNDCEDLIVFNQANHGFLQSSHQKGSFLRLLGIPRELYFPVKRTFDRLPGMSNYVQFCLGCAQLEFNRTTYVVKPDICIDWIPVDILESALVESSASELIQTPGLLDQLREIFRARFRNTHEKRKVSRTILKRDAMLRFARTGRMMDHFWGMRPFTGSERVRILENLLRQVENNPYFNVYFLKDNDALSDIILSCFEDAGVLLLDASTNYTLNDGYSEVMVSHPEFSRLFKEYYDRVLLEKEVLSFKETTDFLKHLIRIAGAEPERETS